MESNSRGPVLEMNGKDKRNDRSEVLDDRTVAGSLFHDADPATANM